MKDFLYVIGATFVIIGCALLIETLMTFCFEGYWMLGITIISIILILLGKFLTDL